MEQHGYGIGVNTPPKEHESYAVEAIRKEYARDAHNAEDHARKLSEHIEAVDRELDALSVERGELAKKCLMAAEEAREGLARCEAVAKNDYRDPSR